MATKRGRGEEPPELDRLIEEIVVDAYDDDEQLWAFRQAFEDNVAMPAEAFVVGEPVKVMMIDYDGNERRGLTAKCQRGDGVEQVMAACDLVFPEGSTAARYLAAYRKWLGIEPHPQGSLSRTRRRPQKATEEDIDMTRDVELIAVAVKGNAGTNNLHVAHPVAPVSSPSAPRGFGIWCGAKSSMWRHGSSGVTGVIHTSPVRSKLGDWTYPPWVLHP